MRLALLMLPLLVAPALAQPLPETVLHLAETAEVTRAPDELRATFRAEARAGTAAAAQEAVNRAVAAALTRGRAVPGVQVATGGYWTNRNEDPRGWVAAQTVTLRGREAAPLLELAGTLQASGLAMAGLEWGLTRELEEAARDEAGRAAIDTLRRRAEAVATQLGMQVAGIRELRLNAPGGAGPRPMRAEMRAAAAPPVAVPEVVVVGASAEAMVVLRVR